MATIDVDGPVKSSPELETLAEGQRAVAAAASLVRSLREKAGLSHQGLAARAKTTQTQVSAVENAIGRHGPTVELLARLVEACGEKLTLASALSSPHEKPRDPLFTLGPGIGVARQGVIVRRHIPIQDQLAALQPHVRALAHNLAGDPRLANDIVYATMLSAQQLQQRIPPGTNLKVWLFKILRNRLRSATARRQAPARLLPPEGSPVELGDFKRAVEALSSAHKEVLVLVAGHGLSYGQVAQISGREVGMVKKQVRQALAQMREMLGRNVLPLGPHFQEALVKALIAIQHHNVEGPAK